MCMCVMTRTCAMYISICSMKNWEDPFLSHVVTSIFHWVSILKIQCVHTHHVVCICARMYVMTNYYITLTILRFSWTLEPSIPKGLTSKSKLSSQFQAQTPVENSKTNDIPEPHPPPTTPTKTRSVTPPSSIVTPQAVKSGLAKSPEATTPKRQHALEAEGSILANGRTSKTPSPDAINDKNTTKDRSSRSPISPRPPSSLRVKSAGDKSTPSTSGKTSPGTPRTSPLISNKTSPATPRKTPSPKALRLPKLAPSPIPQEASPATTETQVKISLPKLMEPSSQVTRMAY